MTNAQTIAQLERRIEETRELELASDDLRTRAAHRAMIASFRERIAQLRFEDD